MNAWLVKPLPIVSAGAVSTAAGYSALNVANDFAGIVWRSNPGDSALYFYVDLGANPSPVDTFAFFGCDDATNAMLLDIVGADDSAISVNVISVTPTVSFVAGSTAPVNEQRISLTGLSSPVTRRWWRFTFYNVPASGFAIGRIVLGMKIQLARNFGFGAAFGVRDFGSLDFSARGVMLRRDGAKLRTTGLTFSSVHRDEVEATIEPLIEQIGNTRPIALITDPAADEMRERRCYFGPLVGDLGTIWRTADAFEWRANLVSLF